MKKVAFLISVAMLAFAQAYFIYALLQPGAADSFAEVWSSFGTAQTTYTQFVFSTIRWWIALPLICLTLGVIAVLKPSRYQALIAFCVSVAGTIALYGSVYAPALFIKV